MESLRENRLLMYAIGVSSSLVIMLASGLFGALSETFEIIDFPSDVSL